MLVIRGPVRISGGREGAAVFIIILIIRASHVVSVPDSFHRQETAAQGGLGTSRVPSWSVAVRFSRALATLNLSCCPLFSTMNAAKTRSFLVHSILFISILLSPNVYDMFYRT